MDKWDIVMKHISREFPNNRFVMRQHARFAADILADRELAQGMFEKAQLAKRNVVVNKDHIHEWGRSGNALRAMSWDIRKIVNVTLEAAKPSDRGSESHQLTSSR
jgi:hypothetical protein